MLKRLYQKLTGKSEKGAENLPSAMIIDSWPDLFKDYNLLWHTALDTQHASVIVECCNHHLAKGFSLNWMAPFEELPSSLLNSEKCNHTQYAIQGLNLLPDMINYSLTVKNFSLLRTYVGVSLYFFKKCEGASLEDAVKAWKAVESTSLPVWESCAKKWAQLDMPIFEEVLSTLAIEDEINVSYWRKLIEHFNSSQLVELFNAVSPSYVAKPLPLEGVESRSLQPELRVFRVVDPEISANVAYEIETLFSCLLVLQSFLLKETGMQAWPGIFLMPEQFGSVSTTIAKELLTLSATLNIVKVYHTPFNGKGLLDNNVLLSATTPILTFLAAWKKAPTPSKLGDLAELHEVLKKSFPGSDLGTFAIVCREDTRWKIAYRANVDKP